MKTILTASFLILLSIQIYPQQRNIKAELGTSSTSQIIQEIIKSNYNDFENFNLDGTSSVTQKRLLPNNFTLIEQIFQEWVAVLSRWINDSLVASTYDENNNLTETVFKNWENYDWIDQTRILYQYDISYNLIEEITQNWEGTDWYDHNKILRIYDVNNQKTEELNQHWSGANWDNKTKIAYSYDSNNYLMEELIQKWTGTAWMDSAKVTRTYDINNNLTIITQNWDGNTWIDVSKILQTYDLSNKLIGIVTQNWNGATWVNDFKITLSYDGNNNIVEKLWQNWYGGIAWANYQKYTYTYDNNNNMTQELIQEWIGPEPYSWKNKSKSIYEYGFDNELMLELTQIWSGTNWLNDIKCTYRYNGNSTWNGLIEYRNEPKGDIEYRRESILNGNQVRTLFANNGEVGHWPDQPSGEWPIGTGQSYIDGVAVLVASEITAPGNSQVVHPLQTSYREWMDKDPTTGEFWGFEPVPGYSSPNSSKIAMSNDPTSWPDFWPAALNLTSEWDGHWYGYFGRDVFNADLETFFVMDDSRDKEWTVTPFNYFPLASDHDRAGLGLRVEVRSFQWSLELAEDIVFWHYDIINISDYNYPNTFFGFYTDCAVGGTIDSDDDRASSNKILDLTYSFDNDGIGQPGGWTTGYYGYAYLESPGNATNGIDDDEDGMIDERRDDGIDNDVDWISFSDLNNNSVWDPNENEPLNDDLGRDGIGPSDPNYPGQDEGEGNGYPTDGEPNFDKTDIDESDQIGLAALSVYRLGQSGTGGGWPKDDESMWLKMSSGVFDTSLQNANISMVFAAGPFPLNQALRERFSMALLFGENLEDLINNKNIAQLFYNNNYKLPDSLTEIDENSFDLTIKHFQLFQNYPNPFNPNTTISFSLPKTDFVDLKIFNLLGQEVATLVNEEKHAGTYDVEFDASNLSSGIYLYKIKAGNFIQTRKMILLK